jgi:hypothetical protein
MELDLSSADGYITLPCGYRTVGYVLLEDVWQETGCDMPRERGHWTCGHCFKKYFFYLFDSQN